MSGTSLVNLLKGHNIYDKITPTDVVKATLVARTMTQEPFHFSWEILSSKQPTCKNKSVFSIGIVDTPLQLPLVVVQ